MHRRFSKKTQKSPRKSPKIKRVRQTSKTKTKIIAGLTGISLALFIYLLYNSYDKTGGVRTGSIKSFSKQSRVEDIAKNHGYIITNIRGDGSCMFRSIADQINGNQDKQLYYRKRGVDYLRTISKNYEIKEKLQTIIDAEYKMSLDEYLESMEDKERNMWGDEIMLQALANVLERRIIIIHFDSTKQRSEIIPTNFDNEEIPIKYPDIAIGHFLENHYVSLRKL